MNLNSKQRAYLKSLASTEDVCIHVGKSSITPEVTNAIKEALDKRELVKVGVLKNCADDPKDIAIIVSERTKSTVVQVIGKKIVSYKPKKEKPVIILPVD